MQPLLLTILRASAPATVPLRARPRLRAGYRAPFEFYPTPPEVVRALLDVETFHGKIWEPACGDGAVAKELTRYGYDVAATDITDWGYGTPGIDFLSETAPRGQTIITNPPYGHGLADRFVHHALALTAAIGGQVAMLLNLASLCHPSRTPFFEAHPPRVIYAVDECICWPCGDPALATPHTRRHRYAWVIWDHQHDAGTAFGWLSTRQYRNHQHIGGNS